MALGATIFKAQLAIADMDRHYYADHNLTLARHPSETDERMMVRLLAFVLYADERLVFAQGLASDEEPDLWQKDLTGRIERWIMVGMPDEKEIRKACGRADQVVVLSYGRAVPIWWQQNQSKLQRLNHLTVLSVNLAASTQLATWAERTMSLQASLQEGQLLLTSDAGALEVPFTLLCGAPRS